jgi:hypothetical protein
MTQDLQLVLFIASAFACTMLLAWILTTGLIWALLKNVVYGIGLICLLVVLAFTGLWVVALVILAFVALFAIIAASASIVRRERRS